MAMFARKKEVPALEEVPVDEVISMRQQGYANNDIIKYLQNKGYASSQVYDALNQADIQQGNMQPEMPPMGMEQQPQFQPEIRRGGGEEKERIEEIAEAIIDEKWNELIKDINKVVEWKNKTEVRLAKIEESMKDLKEMFESLHKGILGKISEYDKNITDVGVEIKAMEKVFQQVLPTFTDNVKKLSFITDKLSRRK